MPKRRLTMCIAAAALFAGCGDLRQAQDGMQPPIGATSRMPQAPASAAHAGRSTSWMLAEANAVALLYVTNSDNSGGGTVAVYTYPKGKLVGTLTGFNNPTGSCVDNVGNVFITDSNGRAIYEYAHGGIKPINTLETAGQQPIGCAIDPITGNLAVATDGESASVAVYRNARGKPVFYKFAPEGDAYYCSYDDSGNLFADGFYYEHYNNGFQLAELPSRKHKFQIISINEAVGSPGQIQWYRNYLAVGDNENNVIDHVYIQGDVGTVKGQTAFARSSSLYGFSIVGRRLVNPEDVNLEVFKYPQGGTSIGTISDDNHPSSVSLSFAHR